MRLTAVLSALFTLSLVCTGIASAAPFRVLESDGRGVTLRLEVGEFTLSAPDARGESRLRVAGLEEAVAPGRPVLPAAATLVAVPPGAMVSVRVIGEEGLRLDENVSLAIGPRSGLRGDGGPLGTVPFLEPVAPILEAWPAATVEAGATFTVRRQHVVALRAWPFRYDPGTRRLTSVRAMTVRVEFSGGDLARAASAPEPDGPFEPLFRRNLVNYEQGTRWRTPGRLALEEARRAHPEGGAPAETEPEVRVRLDTTGVYAIEFDELAAHGYPAGVPVAEVSLHRHEYIQDPPPSSPAHATIELPIEVVDSDGNGTFGSGDRILAYVQSWAERSRASIAQREWGDGEVVYVTRTPGSAALRVPTRPGGLGATLTPLASYPTLRRFEKNNFYVPVFQPGVSDTGNMDQFVWVPAGEAGSLVQLYAEPDSFRFDVNDLDTTRQVRFTVAWRGTRNDGHLSYAHVRNAARRITSIVDSVTWFGRGLFTRTATLFGSALSEGNTNVLRCWGRTQPCPNPIDCQRVFAVNDWFEVAFWRRYKALNGYLAANNAGASGDYEIHATGFNSANLRVYDVTDSIRPVRLTIGPSQIGSAWPFDVRFQDNAAPGALRRYVVFDNPRRLGPERYSRVTRENLAQGAGGDYLLIVPEAFRSAVEPLRQLRESQGIPVVVATLEAVNDEFNGGRKSSYAIRRFIRHAYRNWNSHYVLLVGDASSDPQHFVTTHPNAPQDWIPAQKISGPVPISDGTIGVQEAIPSDPWYVWCVDCPSIISQRKIHDLFIGRLPVNSLSQTRTVIDKIVAYETTGATGDQEWKKRMVLLADDAYSTLSFFGGGTPGDAFYCYRGYEEIFLDISRAIRDSIAAAAGLTQIEAYVFDLGDSLANEPHLPPPNETCRTSWPGTQQSTRLAVSPKLFQRLSAGVSWWNYQGHANPQVMTHEDLYVNRGPDDDKDRMDNIGKPFLYSGFSCHPNFFSRIEEATFGPSFGEDLVNLPERGAIASWGSSGYEIIPYSDTHHLNNHFARALLWHNATPPMDSPETHSEPWNGQVRLGEAVAEALLDNLFGPGCEKVPSECATPLEREVGISYHLLGDPATVFSIGAAQMRVTANGQEVIHGEPVRLLTPADTLRIVADIASNQRIARITLERTDRNGTVVIDSTAYSVTLWPDSSRSAGRRFRLSYFTTLGEGDYRYTIRTVDATGVPSTFDIVFRFFVVLRSDGRTVSEGDRVRPDADLQLLVISPTPITDPQSEFTLRINGAETPFTATPAPGDPSGREWVVTWDHAPYADGTYEVQLTVPGGFAFRASFTVESVTAIENAFAFPNPFDEELGTHFSFTLSGDGPTNVLLRVYTVSGKLIYDRTLSGILPGYHQIAWSGEDAESDKLANGLYLYRIVARGRAGQAVHEGRLVKLRKPVRRAPIEGE